MKKDISRRTAFQIGGLGLVTILAGCTTRLLSTNALGINDVSEEQVCTNEEDFEFARMNLLGNPYLGIPMNNPTRKLKGGEPSYALIPESKSRVKIKDVGEKGGKVIIDAPEGDLYMPYNYSYDVKSQTRNLSVNFSQRKPTRIITDFNINELKKPLKGNGKIILEKVTVEDFPFVDETLKVLGKGQYLIFGVRDYKEFKDKNILPIYFVKVPFDVEYNRSKSDQKIRVFGETYLFKKGLTMNDYIQTRKFANPIAEKQKQVKQTQSGSTDTQKQ